MIHDPEDEDRVYEGGLGAGVSRDIWWETLCFLLLLFSRSVLSDSFVTPWAIAHQVPLSVGFPSQEY